MPPHDVANNGMSASLVEEERASAEGLRPMFLPNQWPQELLLFSGGTKSELANEIAAVQDFILAHPDESIARLSKSLATRQPVNQRLAVIASDMSDLRAKLKLALEKLSDPGIGGFQIRGDVYFAESDSNLSQSRVAFLFPGYGSYYPGMLADLGVHFPFIREWFDHLDEIFDETGGELPSRLVFPLSAGLTSDERQFLEHRLHDVHGGAQGGLTATLALHDLLERLGIRCDVMVGHSNGE